MILQFAPLRKFVTQTFSWNKHKFKEQIAVKILTEPYIEEVEVIGCQRHSHEFINVETIDTKYKYRILNRWLEEKTNNNYHSWWNDKRNWL